MMKRRNFLNCMFGTAAVIASKPVVSEVLGDDSEPDAFDGKPMTPIKLTNARPVGSIFSGDLINIRDDGELAVAKDGEKVAGVYRGSPVFIDDVSLDKDNWSVSYCDKKK